MSTDRELAADQPVMVRAIQVRNFRSLRHVDLRLGGSFYVLVGPNGSGKSTLLDAIMFVSDLLESGPERAVAKRTRNFQDLVWGRPDGTLAFELAVEFDVADQAVRYEVRIEETSYGVEIVREHAYLAHLSDAQFTALASADRLVGIKGRTRAERVFNRDSGGAFFYAGRERLRVNFAATESAMRLLPVVDGFKAGAGRPPLDLAVALAVAASLSQGVQFLQLDSRRLRKAARPNGDDGSRLADDGSNLPRVLAALQGEPDQWKQWIAHLRKALPGLQDIRVVHREDDRHDYLMVKRDGVEVPSWGVSEGTLRLLALTVIPHLRSHPLMYLLEEPENGIHPLAIEFAYKALSTVYGAQVFVASHSPTLLRCVAPAEVLCFGHDSDRGTVIVHGDEHPRLSAWQGAVDDEVFWAADILA